MKIVVCVAALAVLVLSANNISWAAPVYRVTYLGGSFSNGISASINNRGQVVGDSGFQGFINDNGHTTILGTLGAPFGNIPQEINDAGQVVGSSLTENFVSHAYLYSNGSLKDLGALPGYPTSAATDINASGVVVGVSSSPDGSSSRAFLYRDNMLTDLGSGAASAINASGEIVGTSGNNRAVRYENNTMIDLGDFGESALTSAVDINDWGQIAGYSYVRNPSNSGFVAHPFLYESGVWRDLGLPTGVPLGIPSAINNKGQIVGNSNGSLGSNNRPPFLYTDGVIYNLQSLLDESGAGIRLQLAYDINDSGVILAQGNTPTGTNYAAVLLTPVPVPEPSPHLLSGFAALLGGAMRVRRRKIHWTLATSIQEVNRK